MSVPDLLCIGAVHWDVIGTVPGTMLHGADLAGRIVRQPGGVALNVAVSLRRLGMRPALLSALGMDREGDDLIAACADLGLVTDHLTRLRGLATDRYMALEDAAGLIAAIADARTLEAAGAQILSPLADGRLGTLDALWRGPVAVDGNLTEDLIALIAASPHFAAADLRVAPASPDKAGRLRPLLGHNRATLYVNLEEASVLADAGFADAPAAAQGLVERGARRVLVTDGGRASAEGQAGGDVISQLPPQVDMARVTGAGDSFMAAHIVADLRGASRQAALAQAIAAAASHVSGGTDP